MTSQPATQQRRLTKCELGEVVEFAADVIHRRWPRVPRSLARRTADVLVHGMETGIGREACLDALIDAGRGHIGLGYAEALLGSVAATRAWYLATYDERERMRAEDAS